MNFFKSAKYKLGGGGKNKDSGKQVEHFQKIDKPVSYNEPVATKGKAPPTPSDVNLNNDVIACFRLSNKTSFPWKMKEAESESIFPAEVESDTHKLVRLSDGQTSTTATYEVDVDGETHQFTVKIGRHDDVYKLNVDWKTLAELDGIQLKPDSTGSAIELSSEEALVEATFI